MRGSWKGSSAVVEALLNHGASVSIADDIGLTALLLAAQNPNLAVTRMLVKAGADLEAKTTSCGSTPLHLATNGGHWEVIRTLIEAGANPNSLMADGSTALLLAAARGCGASIRELLQGKADPTVGGRMHTPSSVPFLPLDAAVQGGHLEAVRELIRQLGLEGCWGPTKGVRALSLAANEGHLEILATLRDAGVVDRDAAALMTAVGNGRMASAKLLLKQDWGTAKGRAYVNTRPIDGDGATLLCFCCPQGTFQVCFPRMMRLLIDAGADTTSPVFLPDGGVLDNLTPLDFVSHHLRKKKDMMAFPSRTNSRKGWRPPAACYSK